MVSFCYLICVCFLRLGSRDDFSKLKFPKFSVSFFFFFFYIVPSSRATAITYSTPVFSSLRLVMHTG